VSSEIENKLDRLIELLETVAADIGQFRQFVLEVTPEAAIESIEELETELAE
tara:strand:+ start:540 stop:695 length:156 start_codon:yes stop_codon:yes gene_type:complete